MRRVSTIIGLPVAAMLCAASISCQDGSEGRVPVFPVQGQLLYQGKPAEAALVIFHPSGEPSHHLMPHGRVQADGTFVLTTYEQGDGAPRGEYRVTCFWPEPPDSPVADPDSGPDRLKGRYRDPQSSRLRARVEEGSNILEPFQLD